LGARPTSPEIDFSGCISIDGMSLTPTASACMSWKSLLCWLISMPQ
jgi:hypothetical protein